MPQGAEGKMIPVAVTCVHSIIDGKQWLKNCFAHYIPDLICDELGILLQKFRWTTI